jgi:hypothetical protein
LKSLTQLWSVMAKDFAIRCYTSATMDIKTVQGRSKHEGLSFFTITLPSFGKDFQKSLNDGVVSRDAFQGFSWSAGLPCFLRGFLENVFDRTSGTLLDEPDIESVLAIRQLTLLYSKVLLPCSDAREKDAMADYIQCEQEVRDSDNLLSSLDYDEFRRISNLLFSSLFAEVDSKVYHDELRPKHGPGATADKLRGNSKYRQRTWTDRLERGGFHSGSYLFSNARYFNEHYDEISFLEPGEEIPVKVISVPKTQKTPRIIAIEPTCMQYTQQALSEAIVQGIEARSDLNALIGFSDQTPNQRMAEEGSKFLNLATLDLSEASDRVSNQLVRNMLRDFPHLMRAVEATRSRRARVPGHGVIRLAKFASMGSALCFPIEAIVFTTLVFMGIQKELNVHFSSKRDFRAFIGSVRIYGDDIICPVDSVYSVVESLEHFGARVGLSKSFWIGRFRESCGKEYYDGTDVSIVKCRRLLPTSQNDVPEVISLVSFRNQLYFAGCWDTVKWLDVRIRKILKYFPNVLPSSSLLGRNSFLGYSTTKEHEHLHYPLVKGFEVSSILPIDRLEGDGALLKFFLKRGSLPSADRKHLERSGRPRAVDIKPRWARPY